MPSAKKPNSSTISERIKNSPNATLCQYLDTWYHQAATRNDRLQFVYRKALLALLEQDISISRFSDLEKIKGIGPNIRSRLERCYTEEYGPLPSGPSTAVTPALPQTPTRNEHSQTEQTVSRSAKKPKEYIPIYRSGPYAMLIALFLDSLRVHPTGYLTRAEIVQIGQQYCNVSLEEGQFSAIGGAIKTLVTKSLVIKGTGSGNKTKYILSPEGAKLAERLWNSGERRSSIPLPEIPENETYRNASIDTSDEENNQFNVTNDTAQSHELLQLSAGDFDIILFIDSREVKSSAGEEHRNYIVEKLKAVNLKCEQKPLELGDFLWVARSKTNTVTDEFVLDLIVERKREDDLVSSITDGRFKEQKFRLRNCGIDRLIYLVEKTEHLDYGNVGKERFDASIIRTHAIDGMSVKFTTSLDDTIKFIQSLTALLHEEYGNKDLTALSMCHPINKTSYTAKLVEFSHHHGHPIFQTFACFCQINSKSANLTIRDVFAKQLLTIRGITPEKALQITDHFPSAMALWRHFQLMPTDRRPLFFSIWKTEDGRKYGPTLSRRIFNLFYSSSYSTNDNKLIELL